MDPTNMTATTGAGAASSERRFWCHECARHVATRDADDGSGELCCAACGGNFVEEVEADDPPEQFLAAPADGTSATATTSSPTSPRQNSEGAASEDARIHVGPREASVAAAPHTPPSSATDDELAAARAAARRPPAATAADGTPPRRGDSGEGDAPSPLTELFQQLVNGGGGAPSTRTARIIRSNGTPVEFYVTSSGDAGLGELGGGGGGGGLFGLLTGGGFVGNPGDYALGPNHLSQLINQLMQNDPNRHGAPPAAKEVVEKLPSHKVEQREVDTNAECAVCKDLFAVNDDAKDLPCAHSFHPDCIMPWLKMHNSCPVCRFELPTDDQDYEEHRRHHHHDNHHRDSDQAAVHTRW